MLARNSPTDRAKAISYVEQAVSVIEQSIDNDEAYPMDERFWLLSMSYNTGFECLELVPGGTERAEKISETYRELLSRYGPH
ncbi:hypothetical protein CPB85DRAFT_1299949 [Mucidula mucida]|nr:hypothetical protein CPB85DRAFT_1299949 [Mucidula mucida]